MVRDGLTALQHWNSNPATVKMDGTDRVYTFVPKYNVSLAWVQEQDVEKLLSIKAKTCECNGGAYTQKFRIASDINVSIHETGTYP